MIDILEAHGSDLDRIAENVGLRRGYTRENDASLRSRALKRSTALAGQNIRRGPSPRLVKKSRYDIAREDGQTSVSVKPADFTWKDVLAERQLKMTLRLLNQIDDEVQSGSDFTARSVGDRIQSYTKKIRDTLLKEVEL